MQAYIPEIIPLSTIHWPGKTSLTILFSGCNFNCCYCSKNNIIETKKEFLKNIKDIKLEIKNNLHSIDSVYFSGAEPLLQRQSLINLAKFAKEKELKTGLETNGSRPETLDYMINTKLLDLIVLGLNSPLDEDLFEKITRSSTFFKPTNQILKSIDQTLKILKKNPGIDIEIRTTIIPSLLYKKEHLLEIAELIKDIECIWVLQAFDPEDVKNKFKNIEPPTKTFLENLKRFCLEKYPQLRIEIK